MKTSEQNSLSHRIQEFTQFAELKQLAYNVIALQQEKKFHSLAVLSFLPGEGKTLFCAAMATAYVEICRARTLVLDTTTFQNKDSLILGDCFNGSAPQVDVISLEQLRHRPQISGAGILPAPGVRLGRPSALEAEVIREKPANIPLVKDSDVSLIKKAAEDGARQYGLVLLDTAPLHAKNRSNIDPLLVARLSEASVLVVSRDFLDSPNVGASLKVLNDPALHLVGMISNEGYSR